MMNLGARKKYRIMINPVPNRIDNAVQWVGAVLIILGHILNTHNLQGDIVCFFLGTVFFYA